MKNGAMDLCAGNVVIPIAVPAKQHNRGNAPAAGTLNHQPPKHCFTKSSSIKITTDKWTGYIPLKADFENLTRVASGKKGSNFPELHRVVMNLKSWLRGVHHHVNDLQDYLNEYCYRFNRSFMKENIFDNLMKRMIEAEPCYIKNISQ
jgi:hypothetical protein